MIIKATILILCLVGLSFGAKYRGRDIDGKKYEATVKGKGELSPALVQFDGLFVYIYFEKRIVTAKLANEDIENPHDIEASDGTNVWTIDVSGLD
jgi:hypothetical protein